MYLLGTDLLEFNQNRQNGKNVLKALVIPSTRAAEPRDRQDEVLVIIGQETRGKLLGVSLRMKSQPFEDPATCSHPATEIRPGGECTVLRQDREECEVPVVHLPAVS